MDKLTISGLIVTPLKIIHHQKGDIFHGIKKSEKGFAGFGEAYFTSINTGEVKGWNRHKRMTLNLIVPVGEVTFVLFDARKDSNTSGCYYNIDLSQENYQRLTVPPGVWLAFTGKSKSSSLILNVSDMEHDPDEVERLELDKIHYNWDSI